MGELATSSTLVSRRVDPMSPKGINRSQHRELTRFAVLQSGVGFRLPEAPETLKICDNASHHKLKSVPWVLTRNTLDLWPRAGVQTVFASLRTIEFIAFGLPRIQGVFYQRNTAAWLKPGHRFYCQNIDDRHDLR